jgi:pimeloyl-ACP methyl ester carboxylesterase
MEQPPSASTDLASAGLNSAGLTSAELTFAGLTSAELTFAGLAGTLTLPADGSGPFPVVLLLTGSGPIDRDSNHKKVRFDVTAQLSDALARAGVASFRYDKRGVGASPGDWRASGLWDNVDDAAAALAMLRGRPEVDASMIVVAGHSEGATQAIALAARDRSVAARDWSVAAHHRSVAGLVLLAASARRGEELLLWQARQVIPTLPRPVRLLLKLLPGDPVEKVRRNHAKLKATTTDVARLNLAKINAKWFREFLAYDPADDLAMIDVPVLAITGEKDLQVDAGDLALIADLVSGPVATHALADLTHSLRRQPGAPSLSRYKQEVREPVDPELVSIALDWMRRHVQ